jgi:transposase-like protein
MHRRKWDATTKALVVLEGLKGKPVAEIYTVHQSSQSLYDQWRDQYLANAAQAFESQQQGRREARLGRENARLEKLVGELLLERNKSDELLG